ncbi:lytic transglycosylase domain-containing protein [Ramlibacter sp. AN1015]|uniref:lytic transglycosylase domain-containing protein n=1 Tax=Ramlibacter sp. AN1015 TaxID=3133428 RepID=UPI0030BD6594
MTPHGATLLSQALRGLRRCAAVALPLLACAPAAWADVWGYIDGKGTAHFASARLDDRYELFFRGGEAFDTARGLPPPQVAEAQPAAAPQAAAAAGTPAAAALAPSTAAISTAAAKLLAWLEHAPGYKAVRHHLRDAAQAEGIEYELLKALIAAESGFDPQAVSPKGAVGLMQVMPATAERFGLRKDERAPIAQRLTEPRTNVRVGTRYLRYLIDRFPGRLELALAAYNAGEGAVRRAGNRVPAFRETQKYVATVMQIYASLKPPDATDATSVLGAGPVEPPQRVRMELRGGSPAEPAEPGARQPAGAASAHVPELPGAYAATLPAGGARGRGNLPSSPSSLTPSSDNSTD